MHKLLCLLALLSLLAACGNPTADSPDVRGMPLRVLEAKPLERASQQTASTVSALNDYQRVTGISGNLSSAGSDTLANLMTLWSEAFTREYPSVNVQVQAAGSSTAPPALVEGTANFGPMSRALRDIEIEAFEDRYGYRPTAVRVAIDAVAVFVHKDNPLQSLSLQQLDSIFSVTRRCGARRETRFWGDLGLTGGWYDRPIQLFGRNSVSGTYGYFKSVALCSGDYRNSLNEQPGSASVVQAVASSLDAVGYSGIGYKSSGVKALAISTGGADPVIASLNTAADGTYPLSRYFYIYVNKPPNQPLPPLEREFLRLVLSRQGQEIVAKDGYIPISAQIAARELAKLE